jgi:3-hydroxyacyl-[acyl-carrier-protein] dehydratase
MNTAGALERALIAFDAGVARLRFGGDEFFFQGHFPGTPLLPATVQVAAALHFGARLAGGHLTLTEVARATFTSPTGPGRELALELRYEPGKLRARLRDGENTVSDLSLRVEPRQ